jgi:hypothetical protein
MNGTTSKSCSMACIGIGGDEPSCYTAIVLVHYSTNSVVFHTYTYEITTHSVFSSILPVQFPPITYISLRLLAKCAYVFMVRAILVSGARHTNFTFPG